MTVLYGVLDQADGTFAYARAGHELPLCWDAAGAPLAIPRQLEHPLGLLPAPALDVQTITVPPGGALLLYTDGVTEAMDATGQLFDLKRLHRAMDDQPAVSAQERCEHLLRALTAYRGVATQADDITLLLVQRAP